MKVMNGPEAEVRVGNCLPLSEIPVGTQIHNIELHPGKGGQMVRSAGNSAQLMAKEGRYATLRLPSGEMRMVPVSYTHLEQIGMRGVPVVGMSYCAVQGALVVGNKHMTYMVDNNKSESGIENEVLGCNTLCEEDAIRALAMLKTAMGGEEVKAAEKKWNPNVKSTNVEPVSYTHLAAAINLPGNHISVDPSGRSGM